LRADAAATSGAAFDAASGGDATLDSADDDDDDDVDESDDEDEEADEEEEEEDVEDDPDDIPRPTIFTTSLFPVPVVGDASVRFPTACRVRVVCSTSFYLYFDGGLCRVWRRDAQQQSWATPAARHPW
jgi:hypothetical protein